MILAHYTHRLPASHDIGLIRTRASERGPLWDATPNLYFKAFLLREAGKHGAIAHSYSSLYLWRHDDAFRDFLLAGRYKVVTDAFGRAEIQTRVTLDARKGVGNVARFVRKTEIAIPQDADLTAAFAAEVAANRAASKASGTVVAAVAVDTQSWTFTRILVSESLQPAQDGGTSYEIVYLAKPLLETLPDGSAD